jgi:hypothetical protein
MANHIINGETEPGPGRPTSFKTEYIEQARKLAKLGAVDEEMADFFDVSRRTFYRWKHAHKAFSKALEVGKKHPDQRVLQGLYKRAVGFTMTETKVMQYQGDPVYAEVDVYHPPDVRAGLAWLVNRCGWRHNPTEPTGDDAPEPKAIEVTVVDARLPGPDNADPD